MTKSKRQKHIPIRTCIVTKEKKPKRELMRLVRIGDEVKVDPKGKERGRGANISMDVDVFDEAVKKHLIQKALKLKRKLSEEEVVKLRKTFIKAIDEKKFRKGSKPVTIKVSKGQLKKI